MNNSEKKRASELLNGLINGNLPHDRELEANKELNKILIDPNWSDYIFWSEDYINPNGEIDYEKFFNKIEQYKSTDEYQKNKYIISLVNNLLQKNFQDKSEMQIVNELNQLLLGAEWIDYLFVSKLCLEEDGSLDEKCFIDMVLRQL